VDEAPRPETTARTLAGLKSAFRKDGAITAGNAPGLNSGAAAMIVASADFAERRGLAPMARIASYGIAAVASISLAMSRLGIGEPEWDPRRLIRWVLAHGVNVVIIIAGITRRIDHELPSATFELKDGEIKML